MSKLVSEVIIDSGWRRQVSVAQLNCQHCLDELIAKGEV